MERSIERFYPAVKKTGGLREGGRPSIHIANTTVGVENPAATLFNPASSV